MTLQLNRKTGVAQWLDLDGFEPFRGRGFLGKFSGCNVLSDVHPEVDVNSIFLSGSDRSRDLLPFSCPAEQQDSVIQALKEWAASVGVELKEVEG